MTVPSPWHTGHGWEIAKNPELLRTCPVPLQVEQTFLPRLSREPLPPQVLQISSLLYEISTVVPKIAFSNGSSISYLKLAP